MSQQKTEIVVSAVDKASAVLGAIGARLSSTLRPVTNLAGARGGLGMAVAGTAAAATASVGGLVAFAKSAADAADTVGDLSSRYQISANALQAYGSMVEEAGGSMEDAAAGMGKLKKAMSEALSGGKEQAAAFAGIGISLQQLKGMKAEDVMQKMADAFEKAGDGNDLQKQAVLLELMGKNGTVYMDVMNKGSAAYKARLEEMRADGALLSEEQLKQADQFDSSWKRLTRTLTAVKNTLGLELADKLRPIIESLQKWVVANKDLIASKFAEFLEKLPAAIDTAREVIAGLWEVVKFLAAAFKAVSAVIGPTATALVGIGVLLAPIIVSAAKVGWAIGQVVWWLGNLTGIIPAVLTVVRTLWAVLAANPIGLIIAAIAGLVYVIYQNWDAIVAYVSSAWDRIKSAFDAGFFTGLIQLWLEQWQALGNAILGIIKTILPDSWMPKAMAEAKFTFATDNAARTTAAQAAQAQKQDVKNTVSIKIDAEGRARVTEMKPGSPNTSMDVLTGWSMAAP